ncbi:MAG: DUF6088 family protein [Sphaerochaetaceae bacterium]
MRTSKQLDSMRKFILSQQPGTTFVANDFTNFVPYESARKELQRLVKEKILHRSTRGVYHLPYFSELIQEYTQPELHNTASAIARNNSWKISLSGNSALNYLGLTTQVPNIRSYITNGPNKSYNLTNGKLIFMHRSCKEISEISALGSIVIQGIKALGKDNISQEKIDFLRNRFNDQEKQLLLEDSRKTTIWIGKVLKQIGEMNHV